MATAVSITTEDLCSYGCGNVAKWQFKQGKICCSSSYNSCPEKRRRFSSEVDHSVYSAKSLETRTRLGITKSSQIKAGETRRNSGHYIRLAVRMREIWADRPWNNQCRAGFRTYKETGLAFQGSYEFEFLSKLEEQHSQQWIVDNVKRGPATYLKDPNTGEDKLYLPDFQIGNTVYEIKSSYTWDQNGDNLNLELLNKAKLESLKQCGFEVVLVLDHKEIKI